MRHKKPVLRQYKCPTSPTQARISKSDYKDETTGHGEELKPVADTAVRYAPEPNSWHDHDSTWLKTPKLDARERQILAQRIPKLQKTTARLGAKYPDSPAHGWVQNIVEILENRRKPTELWAAPSPKPSDSTPGRLARDVNRRVAYLRFQGEKDVTNPSTRKLIVRSVMEFLVKGTSAVRVLREQIPMADHERRNRERSDARAMSAADTQA